MAAAAEIRTEEVADQRLARRVAEGDSAAFEILYERYFARLYGFVDRRLRNRADTEETVQEVFINVFSSIASYRGDAPFAAWVLGVARRTVASRFKRKRHPTVPLLDEEPESVDPTGYMLQREPTPLEHLECGERIERLATVARDELTAEQRELFELHHLNHRSIAEIAIRMSKSEDAVKSNLYRARKLLLAT